MSSGGLIQDYVYDFNGDAKETLKLDEVVIIQTTDGVNLLNPVSRIESLKFPLSNIRAQYNKRNVLLENIGAIGILSSSNSDLGGSLPMSPEEKAQIRKDWFNRSKDELIISENDVKWTPMSFPTKDLMLFDELKADKLAIIDAFGLNYYIFSNESGSTYSNVNYGERLAYTNTIIPESNKIYDNITEQLGLDKQGLRLKADFSDIPVLQNDILQESQAFDYRASALIKMQNELGITMSDEEKYVFLGVKKGI
jgi:phage portal protein BeeE